MIESIPPVTHDLYTLFRGLGVALALGLLIGVERGWKSRTAAEGSRAAGLRTFGLIGLLGGLWGLLANALGVTLLGFAFLALAALLVSAYLITARQRTDVSVTTPVAALVTFALGALAVYGYEVVAAAGAVVTATLLGFKPVLHHWLERIEEQELYAVLKLLLISVVLLPVLPDHGYGPWQVLNPYEIWWMVVLIAGISFVGYFAVKIAGVNLGIVLTGLFGGLASSTATTLNFARLGARNPGLARLLATGVVASAGTMFPRMLLVAFIVNRDLALTLAWPLGLMGATCYLAALWLWERQTHAAKSSELEIANPFELKTALQFGALLAVVILLAKAAGHWLGHAGIYLLALISGIGDVDAINVSLGRMAPQDLTLSVAGGAIVLAAVSNTVTKALLAFAVGGTGLGLRVGAAFIATLAAGAVGLFLAGIKPWP